MNVQLNRATNAGYINRVSMVANKTFQRKSNREENKQGTGIFMPTCWDDFSVILRYGILVEAAAARARRGRRQVGRTDSM